MNDNRPYIIHVAAKRLSKHGQQSMGYAGSFFSQFGIIRRICGFAGGRMDGLFVLIYSARRVKVISCRFQ